MDTVKVVKPAILVDYGMYSYHPKVRQWLRDRDGKATFVLLVSDPVGHDYDPTINPAPIEGVDFDVVIKNNKPLSDIDFKTAALCAVQDISNLTPVIALDEDLEVQQMFEDGGVLIAAGEEDLLYV